MNGAHALPMVRQVAPTALQEGAADVAVVPIAALGVVHLHLPMAAARFAERTLAREAGARAGLKHWRENLSDGGP